MEEDEVDSADIALDDSAMSLIYRCQRQVDQIFARLRAERGRTPI